MRHIISLMVATLLMATMTGPVSANTTCSEGMIRNSYGVIGSTIIQGMHCGVTGFVIFKSDGTAIARMTQSCGGMVESAAADATYNVYGNCTAVANVEFSDGDSGTFYFTLVDGGKRLMWVGTSSMNGVTFSGTGEQF